MNEAKTTLESADIALILKSLPHRYPFLMIDRVVDMVHNQRATGIKNVTSMSRSFRGISPATRFSRASC
jgi:3-hydroxymyristoyl/3-hydroxydecanoyl-(acyl carrier protein) dehydratases